MLEIRDDQFLILECETRCIEMYQMKIFYYRNITGIKPFRFSMTEKRSYLYYPDKNKSTFVDFVEKKLIAKDLFCILEQIYLIICESKNNLLYETNFSLRPDWIYIDKEAEQMKVELIYLPLKKDNNTDFKDNYKRFIQFIAKLFNELNEMEYFYFFKRLEENVQEEDTQEEASLDALLDVLQQLSKKRIYQ